MLDEKGYPTPGGVKKELEKHLQGEEKKDPDFWKKFDENAKPNGGEKEK